MPVQVSVIMPVYNMEKFVGEVMTSILRQTFTDYRTSLSERPVYRLPSDRVVYKGGVSYEPGPYRLGLANGSLYLCDGIQVERYGRGGLAPNQRKTIYPALCCRWSEDCQNRCKFFI